ncbi:unnamed protein product [Allacma fusca]|uniref:Uncharacterized protein n=1 Tax=Allacma fusca TaxID=39272 RepID=A0A8J2P749_9HEXA|nr:unnamed protein product [Allacma fusca]
MDLITKLCRCAAELYPTKTRPQILSEEESMVAGKSNKRKGSGVEKLLKSLTELKEKCQQRDFSKGRLRG